MAIGQHARVKTAFDRVDSLDGLYASIETLGLTPGWIDRDVPILKHHVPSIYRPAHWRYADARSALDAAGRLMNIEQAERRNLILRNPNPTSDWMTSRTLVAVYQMILPGEVAASHRHASNALRVMIDSEGTHSIVDGEKMEMNSGDVVLTPGGCFHGHVHEGDAPGYWLDCLDVPLSHLLEPMYFAPHPNRDAPVQRIVAKSPFRFARDEIAAGLDKSPPDSEGLHGARLVLPTPSMPNIGLTAERLPGGSRYRRHRTSANRIFSVMSGTGVAEADGQSMSWSRGDTFVIPSLHWFEQAASTDAVLLEMSDEPLMRFANHFFVET